MNIFIYLWAKHTSNYLRDGVYGYIIVIKFGKSYMQFRKIMLEYPYKYIEPAFDLRLLKSKNINLYKFL